MIFASYEDYVVRHGQVEDNCSICYGWGCSECDGTGTVYRNPITTEYLDDLLETTNALIEWKRPKDPLSHYAEALKFYHEQGLER